jgi:zinc protease
MFRLMSLAAAVRATLALAAAASAVAAIPGPAAAAEWPQAHSDLRADPAVLFGSLPNGMRYAIMHNATPKGAVSMWLDIGAGSLEESDAQQGLAHFLEHMAFRGSKHVPEDQVWPGLQRLGMEVGADANAATLFGSTQFQFNLPRNDAATVDSGLLRLRDIAGDLTLAQSAMDAERGVILSEERLRDSPGYRMAKHHIGSLFPNGRPSQRMPIGLTEIIKHAPVSDIRDYYNAYYRPERATLVVIGDIDQKAIQEKILKLFSDWKPVGPAGAGPVTPAITAQGPQADLFVEAGAPSLLSLDFVLKAAPDSIARETDDYNKLIAFQILTNRLRNAKNGAENVFVSVEPGSDNQFPGAVIWSVSAVIRPENWRNALDAATVAVRQMQQFGVTAAELQEAKEELNAGLRQLADNARTLPSRFIAKQIVDQSNQNDVYVSPTDSLALAEKLSKALTVDALNTAFRSLVRDRGPMFFISSPTPIEGGKPAVAAALAAAEKMPLLAPAAAASLAWPYTSFGPDGKVVERKLVADLQTTFVRFANGVRLTVKPTTLKTSEIVVNVKIGRGRLDLPANSAAPIWAVSGGRFFLQGLKAISIEDLNRVLSGKVPAATAGIFDTGLMLRGRTRPADLPTLLQVFTAYVSAPGFRPGATERARADEIDDLRSAEASPTLLLRRMLPCLLHDHDARWCAPSAADLASTRPAAVAAMLTPILASAPIEVTMAGNVSVDDAIKATAATFGALPQRTDTGAAPAGAAAMHFPAATPVPVELHHGGRADQGVAALAWPTTDAFDLKKFEALRILKSVLETRMTNRLRIQDAVTYSPSTSLLGSTVSPGYGYLVVLTELPPAKMPLFFTTVSAIATDLKSQPISADELERARKPVIESLLTLQQTNAYWSEALAGAQEDARRLDIIRDTVPLLLKLTPSDIEQTANRFLSDGKAWKLEITAAPPSASLR